jgi:hypothetical protein
VLENFATVAEMMDRLHFTSHESLLPRMDDTLGLADWTADEPQRGTLTTRKNVRCGCTNRVHDSRAMA